MTTNLGEKDKPESDQQRVVEDLSTSTTDAPTPLKEEGVSPRSLEVSGLGNGELEPIEKKKPRKKRTKQKKKEPTSGELLSDLAQPRIFEGPDVELQDKIVARLEKAIPDLDLAAAEARARMHEEIATWDVEFNLRTDHTPEARIEHMAELTKRSKLLPAEKYDKDLLYLGSIELADLPPTSEDEQDLIDGAELLPSHDYALQNTENATALPGAAGVSRHIVQNTILTMLKAGQIDYLRRSGFVGKGWKVVIEVHYYRDRSGSPANLHKDTLGQTLFVNLNYTNKQPMPGPEILANPPLVETHEKELAKNLPPEVLADLEQARDSMPPPTMIDAGILPPNGVVAFVDETIHHATPLLGHREIRLDKVRQFLREDPDFTTHYVAAEAAYQLSLKKPKGLFKLLQKPKQFADAFEVKLSDNEKDQWRALMELCSGNDDVKVSRPLLLKLGMTPDQVDRLLSGYGPDTFNSVNIPSKAREDRSGKRVPLKQDDKSLLLTRRMSQLALDGDLPVDPGGPRRFFRTWVRTVRTDT